MTRTIGPEGNIIIIDDDEVIESFESQGLVYRDTKMKYFPSSYYSSKYRKNLKFENIPVESKQGKKRLTRE